MSRAGPFGDVVVCLFQDEHRSVFEGALHLEPLRLAQTQGLNKKTQQW